PIQMANAKRQRAKGVAQGSPFNPAAFPGLLRSPAGEAHPGIADLVSKSAAFSPFFRPPGADWRDQSASFVATNNEPRTTNAFLRMKLVGANPQAKVMGLEELPGKSNYFIGNDPKKWRTNVPNYAKVKYANVYPGVDLVYYGNQGKLEYDFVVQPGADHRSIQLAINPDAQVGSETAVGAVREPPTT